MISRKPKSYALCLVLTLATSLQAQEISPPEALANSVVQREGTFFPKHDTTGKLYYAGGWYEDTYPQNYSDMYELMTTTNPLPPGLIASGLNQIASGTSNTQFLAWGLLDWETQTLKAPPQEIVKALIDHSKVLGGTPFLPEFFPTMALIAPADNYFQKADLRGASLGNSLPLQNQNISGKDLTGARVTATELARASNITGITLTGTNITRGQLESALIAAGKDPAIADTITF